MTTKHLVIPDLQVAPGHSTEHLTHIGKWAAEKRPDVIVLLGDVADMPSLSSWDKPGTKAFEGRRYKSDIESVHDAMDKLMAPINEVRHKLKEGKHKQWNPRLILTLGNHEDRITRAINNDPKLDGLISLRDLRYEDHGFEVYDFLRVVVVDGVAYSHYFVSGIMGRPITTAQALLTKLHMSCFAGHQQGRQIAYGKKADGTELTAIICGSAYPHDEDYLGVQGNKHFRGIYQLNDVKNGTFDEMALSLSYLAKRYGNK